MSAITFTVTVVPFQLSATEVWTAAKFNQGFNPTITIDLNATGATNGNVLVYRNSRWEASDAPSPADGGSYLGGDGAFHSIVSITRPSVTLYNFTHFH